MGRPTSAAVLEAFGGNIEEGSTLAHDEERSHGKLVRHLGLASELYDADEIKRLPDEFLRQMDAIVPFGEVT